MEKRIHHGIKVISAGPLLTIQDAGRYGYMAYGIGESGVMDRRAYQIANRLVGNDHGEAVLEATLMGPGLEFLEDTVIAITGADMEPTLDDSKVGLYEAIPVKKGQVLHMGFAKTGCRSYIAVAGGIDVPQVFGSRSTNLKCHMGGLHGGPVKNGDLLPTKKLSFFKKIKISRGGSKVTPTMYTNQVRVRVIPGPQDDCFSDQGLQSFYSGEYKVSPQSDRMGIRLEGNEVESKQGTDIISDGIVFGSIQITSSGKPIILMADHQTTGGYAKIGTVVTEDLPLLAQVRPGDQVQFEKIEIASWERQQDVEKTAVYAGVRKRA